MAIKIRDGYMIKKCATCKKELKIDRINFDQYILFEGKSYCHDCFVETAEKRSKRKGAAQEKWLQALQNIDEIQTETDKTVEHIFQIDDIYQYVIKTYMLTNFPNQIFTTLNDIESGAYKTLVKGIPLDDFLDMWKTYQMELDAIANYKTFTTLVGRIMYDIAVLVGKSNDYYAKKRKLDASRAEMKQKNFNSIDVDMAKIGNKKKEKRNTVVGDVFNDLYVE